MFFIKDFLIFDHLRFWNPSPSLSTWYMFRSGTAFSQQRRRALLQCHIQELYGDPSDIWSISTWNRFSLFEQAAKVLYTSSLCSCLVGFSLQIIQSSSSYHRVDHQMVWCQMVVGFGISLLKICDKFVLCELEFLYIGLEYKNWDLLPKINIVSSSISQSLKKLYLTLLWWIISCFGQVDST